MLPERVVADGYDQVAEAYRRQRTRASQDILFLEELTARLPRGARVLDLGCGSGIPVTARLAARFTAVGLDISRRQLAMAKASVDGTPFVRGDMAPFATGSFDGVCSYYAIIHVPREKHALVAKEVFRVLKSGGLALLCMGANDLPSWSGDALEPLR